MAIHHITRMFRRPNSILFGQRMLRIQIQRNISKSAVLGVQCQPATITAKVRNIYQLERRWYGSIRVAEESPKIRKASNVGHLDMRVGKVIEINTDPRFKEFRILRVNIGKENRLVGTTLEIADQLLNKHVILLCNVETEEFLDLKFHGIIMSANNGDQREPLAPPADAIPGDLVCCEGYTQRPAKPTLTGLLLLNSVQPRLRTNGDLIACYDTVPLEIPSKGPITVESLKDTFI